MCSLRLQRSLLCDVFVVDLELSAAGVWSQDVCYKYCDIDRDQENHVCEGGFEEVNFACKAITLRTNNISLNL